VKRKIALSKGLVGPASLLTIGLLYGLSAVVTKYLSDYINAYQVIEYRFGIALLAILMIVAFARRIPRFTHINKWALAAFAISFPASAILFTLSVFHASVAIAVFSFYAANLIAQFGLGRIFFDEKISTLKALAFVASITSLLAFTNPFSDFTLTSGLAFGILSGIIQGVASVFQKQLSNSTDKTSLLLVQTLAGVVMAAAILLLMGEPLLPALSIPAWFIAVGFGLSMLAIMYLFLVGYKHTNLNVGSILVSSELFFAPFLAFILLSERMDVNVLVGGTLAAVATVLVSLPPKKIHKRVNPNLQGA